MTYLLVALTIAAIVVLLAWRGLGNNNGGGGGGDGRPAPRPKPRPTRQVAPDDDAEFLGEIDRRLRGEDKSG